MQLQLPVKSGGFGFHHHIKHAPAAFLAGFSLGLQSRGDSWEEGVWTSSCSLFPDVQHAYSCHLLYCGTSDILPSAFSLPWFAVNKVDQRQLAQEVHVRTEHRYGQIRTKVDELRFRSLVDSGGHAGDWLLAIPSLPPLRMANDEFRFASKLRLGLQVAVLPDKCLCGHEHHNDQVDLGLGYHSMTCGLRGFTGFNPRHKWLLHTWAQIFGAAGLHVESEPKEVFPDTQLRPDHKVYNFGARTLLTDVSVAFPRFVRRHHDGDYTHIANSGVARELVKIEKYRIKVAALGSSHVFKPLVVDAFGRWGQHAVDVMTTCASQCVVGQTFSCPRFFKRHHWRLLSVTTMRALCEQSADYQRKLRHLSAVAAGIAVDEDAVARAWLAEPPEDDVLDPQ